MKVTDYSKIANKYEKNQYRLENVQYDNDLREYIDKNPKSVYQVLDLACGTGIYLDKQIKFFNNFNIDWNGLDASEEMLNKAKEKVENASIINGLAENMPYEDEKFDYISNNYAFHHFINKEQSLNEVYRVLKKNSVYKLYNIAIHDMKQWWVYHYFPTAYYEDLKRFWEKEVIFNGLSIRGFKVNIQIQYRLERIKLSDYIANAENRDISILTLINDQDYQDGLKKMRYELEINPDKTITNDFAEMICIAKKI
ncbi:class I SAM-dependent methyltransferase [Oceanobacillus sp. 1P07AA]|uniref:class I SAM-dependent methyltransferase n=1 Tax=Oceanobacillus sp. 1P07AA TaxID=3132293 RepID=UPI0039A5D63D